MGVKILAVETSCDDTGIAILEASKAESFTVLANIVSSQPIHTQYGGVFPAMAKREHQKNIIGVLTQSLQTSGLLEKSKTEISNSQLKQLETILVKEPEVLKQIIPFLKNYKKPDADLIAVTNGPGLEPCLWVGVNTAKALSYFWNIDLVPVNHIEAHILVNFLKNKYTKFPAISLVVSGGHTQLILMKGVGEYKIIGETRDDAAGECFDKCAVLLGLGDPGGPIISEMAKRADGNSVEPLPRPMMNTKDYDFSFSGLKTAVLYADRKVKNKTKIYKQDMAFQVQQAIIDVLLKKTLKAAKDYKVKSIILGGGVSANEELRGQLKSAIKKEIPMTKYFIPDSTLSTDNGLMIAITGFFNRNKKAFWKNLKADANLRVGRK